MAMAWALSPALAAAAAAASEVFVPTQRLHFAIDAAMLPRQQSGRVCVCVAAKATCTCVLACSVACYNPTYPPRLPGQWWLQSQRLMQPPQLPSPVLRRC